MPTMFDELPRKVFLYILLGSIIFLPVQVQGHAGSDNISHTMANLEHLSGVPDVFSSQWKVRLSGKYFGAAKHFLVFVLALAGAAFMFKEINMGICYSSGADLSMKVAVITGGTRGMGYEVAKYLASRNAFVIVASSDVIKGPKAAEKIRNETKNPFVRYVHLDLGSFQSVRYFAMEFTENNEVLDYLVNNAGIASSSMKVTEDKLNPILQTNYFGHFLLTNLLVHPLMRAKNPKIINVSSMSHILCDRQDMERFVHNGTKEHLGGIRDGLRAFGVSKLANVIFTKELLRQWKGSKISCYSVIPGFVRTDHRPRGIPRAMIMYSVGKNSWQGAQSVLHCLLTDNLENGALYSNCRTKHIFNNKAADDMIEGGKLWKKSAELVRVDPNFLSRETAKRGGQIQSL